MSAAETLARFDAARASLTALTPAFRAWRIPALNEHGHANAIEVDVSAARTLKEAESAAAPRCLHKEALHILACNQVTMRQALHVYTIKRRARPLQVVDPATGCPRNQSVEYAVPVCSVAVDAYEPSARFDARRDCPVGFDRSLVEAR